MRCRRGPPIPLLAVVEFIEPFEGHPVGTVGAVVETFGSADHYEVEILDAEGNTIDIVSVDGRYVRVKWLPPGE
jgi:hypothetical protein